MWFARDNIASEVLISTLQQAKIGIVAYGLIDLNVEEVIKQVADRLKREIHVALVGGSQMTVPNVVMGTDIESAVAWRSQPELAGSIIVFIQEDVEKLHSLGDLTTVIGRDLSKHLLEQSKEHLAHNIPQQRFWEALKEIVNTLPLAMLEKFVQAVSADHSNMKAITENLWHLGLLCDDNLLENVQDPLDRLVHNRELVLEMGRLSESSRRRMSSALRLAKGTEQERLQMAFTALKEFYRRGAVETLARLNVSTVEELIQAGRPKQSTASAPPPEHNPTGVLDPQPEPSREPGVLPKLHQSPLRGSALDAVVANYAVSRDEKSQEALKELSELLRQKYRNPQNETEEFVIAEAFDNRSIQVENVQTDLRTCIGYFLDSERWGGTLRTTSHDFKNIILRAQPEDAKPYNPDDPTQGIFSSSLFSILRSFDGILPQGEPFSPIINRYVYFREQLLPEIDLLLHEPLVLFGGSTQMRKALDGYLEAYTSLLRTFRRNNALLANHDANATRYVATELIRLEVVHIQTPNSWKAMLTPLHPFHLWRFKEIFQAIHKGESLSEEAQHQLAEALPKLPHLLHFLVVSPDVTGSNDVALPQSGTMGLLPTYENRTNRYIGSDGVEFITDLLRRWVVDAPYSRVDIRLGLIDVPDLSAALRASKDFLLDHRSLRLTIDAYFTRQQNAAGELARLDFEGKDYEVGNVLQNGRLTVRIRSYDSISDVAAQLQLRPVHIAYLFDQSQYQVGYAPKAYELIVSPLVITYEYTYSESFRRGTIAPSSEAKDGPFSDFHFLIQQAASLPTGQQLRLQYESPLDLEPINTLLEDGSARWLVLADRVLTPYSPKAAVPLAEQRKGQREIGVWSRASSKSVSRYVELLSKYNLRPEQEIIADLLQRFGHIATGGMLGLPSISSPSGKREAQQKGLLGTVLAAMWYTTCYPGSLVASLDTALARQWLQARPQSQNSERADLVGLRLEGDVLIVEAIEVKSRMQTAEVQIQPDPQGGKRLSGGAIEQLEATLKVLKPIFGEADPQPLFTPARREVLKYQLYRECFRTIYELDWQKKWYDVLEGAFTPSKPRIPVHCQGMVIHFHPEENGNIAIVTDSTQLLTLVELQTQAIQKLVSSSPDNLELITESADVANSAIALPNNAVTASQNEAALPESDNTNYVDLTSNQIKETAASYLSVANVAPQQFNDDLHAVKPVDKSSLVRPQLSEEQQREAEELARRFRRACQSFRIQVEECDPKRVVIGPTVWRFYIRLSRGQRLDPLRNVLEDIGREMRRSGLLVGPLKNSDEIVLDVPGPNREDVSFIQGIDMLPPVTSPEQMPLAIGVTPEGTPLIRDLSDMPHLLVGGTTGAGKTIFLYGLITTLLMTHKTPNSLRLLLCTSKPEDFVFFEGLKHLETGNIISDAEQAIELLGAYVDNALQSRLTQLRSAQCRDIFAYNALHPHNPLPPFVIVVDELADLADQLSDNKPAREAFYTSLRRVAQLGRSRGIHLILCTQRPSADLVPTNIRTLMNARAALRVNDGFASRMILDENGAENLQSRGDILFKYQGDITHVQGYFITTNELIAIIHDL